MVTLKQFNGSAVTPSDDAKLYHLLYGRSGIVTGIQVTHAGTNQVSISAGWGVVYGRVFTVEAQSLGVTLSGGAYGRLKIVIDLSNITTPAYFESEAAASLPTLTQENLSGSGNVYEVPICTYDVGAIAISNIVDARPIVTINSAAHMQMTGYTKPESYAALAATDTVNQAVGKLEAGVVVKANLAGANFSGGVNAHHFGQASETWGTYPLELGEFIDMHHAGSEVDFDVRLALSAGLLHLGNPNSGTFGRAQNGQILTRPAVISQMASFTLDLSHAEGRIWAYSESDPITITIPADASVAFSVGTHICIIRAGNAEVSITNAAGVLDSISSHRCIGSRFGVVSLVKIAANYWVIDGNLKPDSPYLYVSADRDFALTDANRTLLVDATAGDVNLTIRLDSVIGFPVGTKIRVIKSNITGNTINLMRENGVTIYPYTISFSSNLMLEKIAVNSWFLGRYA